MYDRVMVSYVWQLTMLVYYNSLFGGRYVNIYFYINYWLHFSLVYTCFMYLYVFYMLWLSEFVMWVYGLVYTCFMYLYVFYMLWLSEFVMWVFGLVFICMFHVFMFFTCCDCLSLWCESLFYCVSYSYTCCDCLSLWCESLFYVPTLDLHLDVVSGL